MFPMLVVRLKRESSHERRPFCLLAFLELPFALVEALHNRRSSRYLRGLVRQPLRQIEVILLHDVEHRLLGEHAMILGKQLMQVCEFFVSHGNEPGGNCQIIPRRRPSFRTMRNDG